jgi:hypothetical protein
MTSAICARRRRSGSIVNGRWQEGLLPSDRRQCRRARTVSALRRIDGGFQAPPRHSRATCLRLADGAVEPFPSCWRSTRSACATGCSRSVSIHRICTGTSTTPAATTMGRQRRGFGLGRHPLLCLSRRRGAERRQRHRAHRAGRQRLAGGRHAALDPGACWRARLLTVRWSSMSLPEARGRPDRRRPVLARRRRRTLRLLTEQLIWAAPLFLVPQVFAGQPALKAAARSYSYAPWLVANLTLSRFPDDRAGAAPAWDNVLYDSCRPGLCGGDAPADAPATGGQRCSPATGPSTT